MREQFMLRNIETNGITLRAAVEGEGPMVMLVHGWPELWYSWRHQIRPLAEAGYRVVAPDVRGYGGSDKPEPVEAYAMAEIMADLVGLIEAMGEELYKRALAMLEKALGPEHPVVATRPTNTACATRRYAELRFPMLPYSFRQQKNGSAGIG